jgi:hypothetical protein
MRESVIYQELWEEARAGAREEVRQEIRQEVQQEIRQEVRQEEARLFVLRLLERKLDLAFSQKSKAPEQAPAGQLLPALESPPEWMQSRLHALTLDQLEDLGEALLNFSTLADLATWLENLPKSS